MATKKNYVFNLFELLRSLNNHTAGYYNNLDENQQSTVQPLVIMRWMSGCSNKLMVMMINEFVNPYIFPLYQHKTLLIKLLTVCGSRTFTKFRWVPNKITKSDSIIVELISDALNCNERKARDILVRRLVTADDIIEISQDYGYDKVQLKKLNVQVKRYFK